MARKGGEGGELSQEESPSHTPAPHIQFHHSAPHTPLPPLAGIVPSQVNHPSHRAFCACRIATGGELGRGRGRAVGAGGGWAEAGGGDGTAPPLATDPLLQALR